MYDVTKRLLDLTLGSAAVSALAVPLLGVAAVLRVTGEGKVLFRQSRGGYQNKPFGLLKFVTMRTDSEKSGTITVRGDSRILPVGRVLRKTKINELPQLLNVLLGDMSLVGPRPLTDEAFELYPDELKPLIYASKPGLTGIGSVVFRDEEAILADSKKERKQCYREDIMPIKGALEVWYLNHKSTSVDLKIMALTAIAIVAPGNDLHRRWLADLPECDLGKPNGAARDAAAARAVAPTS